MTKRIVVGVSGASGSVLALAVIRQLRNAGVETHLVITRGSRQTIRHELGSDGMARLTEGAGNLYAPVNVGARIGSGSFRTDGMLGGPWSLRSLAAVAHGGGDNLLTRAADVTLKERRRLVIVPREAPLHEGHLTSMLALTRMGAIIAPPMPPFYAAILTVDDMVREIAARLIGWAGVDPGDAMTRWGSEIE